MDDTRGQPRYLDTTLLGQIPLYPSGIMVVGKWINKDKRRYYRLLLGTDLLGYLVLEREWGSLDTKQSNKKTEVFSLKDIEGLAVKLDQVVKTRKSHHYELIDKDLPQRR